MKLHYALALVVAASCACDGAAFAVCSGCYLAVLATKRKCSITAIASSRDSAIDDGRGCRALLPQIPEPHCRSISDHCEIVNAQNRQVEMRQAMRRAKCVLAVDDERARPHEHVAPTPRDSAILCVPRTEGDH